MGVISHVYVSDPQQNPGHRGSGGLPFLNTLYTLPRALLGDDSAGTGDRNPPYVSFLLVILTRILSLS